MSRDFYAKCQAITPTIRALLNKTPKGICPYCCRSKFSKSTKRVICEKADCERQYREDYIADMESVIAERQEAGIKPRPVYFNRTEEAMEACDLAELAMRHTFNGDSKVRLTQIIESEFTKRRNEFRQEFLLWVREAEIDLDDHRILSASSRLGHDGVARAARNITIERLLMWIGDEMETIDLDDMPSRGDA